VNFPVETGLPNNSLLSYNRTKVPLPFCPSCKRGRWPTKMQPWHPSSVINIFGVLDTTELQKRSRFDFTPEVMASYPTPNYVDPVRRGPALYIFNSMFIFIMLVCVTLRLYTRIFIRKWFGLDDAFILCAVVCLSPCQTRSHVMSLTILWKFANRDRLVPLASLAVL
jgi:hypothetical protein